MRGNPRQGVVGGAGADPWVKFGVGADPWHWNQGKFGAGADPWHCIQEEIPVYPAEIPSVS